MSAALLLNRPRSTTSTRGRPWRVVERNLTVYRRDWLAFLSGFFEPVFYLLSIGVGLGVLVGDFTLADGTVLSYAAFVAPGMLASSAMNGAVFDSTYNLFFKLKYAKTYDAMLVTPLSPRDLARGEAVWALMRGGAYATGFLVVMVAMGLVESWWAVLVTPAAVLIGFAFSGAGMAATTFMKSWQDFDLIQVVIMPMFLFSATFYPLSTYPDGIRELVAWTPLYQGVDLVRALSTGQLSWVLLGHCVYLAVMGAAGMAVASRRIGLLLLR